MPPAKHLVNANFACSYLFMVFLWYIIYRLSTFECTHSCPMEIFYIRDHWYHVLESSSLKEYLPQTLEYLKQSHVDTEINKECTHTTEVDGDYKQSYDYNQLVIKSFMYYYALQYLGALSIVLQKITCNMGLFKFAFGLLRFLFLLVVVWQVWPMWYQWIVQTGTIAIDKS